MQGTKKRLVQREIWVAGVGCTGVVISSLRRLRLALQLSRLTGLYSVTQPPFPSSIIMIIQVPGGCC